MKTVLLILGIFIGAQATYSQDVMRMEDDLSTTFILTNMMAIQADHIKHIDLEGKDNTYFAKVEFGKRSFDLEIYHTATKKLLWAHYPILRSDSYFKKNTAKSDDWMEVYTLERDVAGNKEHCEVTFYKGVKFKVSVAYSYQKAGQKVLESMVMGTCDLR